MPIIEGTTSPKSVTAAYDFAVDGGAIGDITLRGTDSVGNSVPAGATIVGGYIDVTTLGAQASGTVALKLEGAADLYAAVIASTSLTTGRKSVIPVGTGATAVRTTVARSIKLTVATAVVTAGKFTVTLLYV